MSKFRRFMRYYIVAGLFVAAMLFTLYRYGSLALRGPAGPGAAMTKTIHIRGPIYDREGRVLAIDTDLYDVSIWRPSLPETGLEALSVGLARASGRDGNEILAILTDTGGPDFAYLARRISGDAARAVAVMLEDGGIGGVQIDRVAGRVYPEKRLAAHLVGFVGTENRGLAGAEAAFETTLAAPEKAGADGYSYGDAVYLTIDADLQFRLEDLGRKALAENAAEALAMVAMDAGSGDILAYVSLPDFDPNDFLAADRSAWLDRVAIYAYEPGSVFKVYSMGSLMSLGGIDASSVFTCDGSYEHTSSGGEEIVIKCLGSHGSVNLTDILKYSCNSGAAYASDTVSSIDFYTRIREFGFGERVGADLAGESPGLIRNPANWSGRTKPTIAIGQETLVTALQMTAAATVLANGGVLVRARTLDRIVRPDGSVVDEPQPIHVRRVMEAGEARDVLDAMEAAVLDVGTGWRARIDDLRMAVKTGTAQMIDAATRRYSETDFIASTIALFPSESPEYIVYAAIFKPKGASTYGGRIAAPLVRDAANIVANLYGVARTDSATAVHPGSVKVTIPPAVSIGGTMPDLRGQPKRALTPLLSRRDVTVIIEGDGWVSRQDPAPGADVTDGMTITLTLE